MRRVRRYFPQIRKEGNLEGVVESTRTCSMATVAIIHIIQTNTYIQVFLDLRRLPYQLSVCTPVVSEMSHNPLQRCAVDFPGSI